MGADDGLGGRIADVAFVAGEIDLRIASQDDFDLGAHDGSISQLIWFVKSI